MKREDQARLLFGPYDAPTVELGGWLECRVRGRVKVESWSHGRISWPCTTRYGSLILCGDLVKAVLQESKVAIKYHWGVSDQTVQGWRRVLNVEPYNTGTQWLMRSLASERSTPRRMRRMSELARPMSRRPKSRFWKKRMSQIVRSRIALSGPIHPDRPMWTAKEDRLLGTDADEKIAKKLGRTPGAVRSRRRALGIALQHCRDALPWTREQEKLLGTKPDSEIARLLGRGERGVQLHRQILGIPAFQLAHKPWTPREDRLLGKFPDQILAKKLGRPLQVIQHRRHVKGIPNPATIRHIWSPAEDALLGTMPDDAVAKKLGLPVQAILRRRSRKGIPNPAPQRKLWKREEIRLLGTRPDKQIAARLGCPIRSVTAKRVHLGIRAFLK